MQTKWEHFSHGADVGIRGIGNSVEEAFEMAAVALTAVICDPNKITLGSELNIHCQSTDVEILFFDWINSLVYEMDTKKMLFSKFKVHINDGNLESKVWGEILNSVKHEPCVEIKGATMTELKVFKTDTAWTAQCVVDV